MLYNYLHEKIIYRQDDVNDFFTIFHCGVTCPDIKYDVYHTGSAPYHVFEFVTRGKGFFEYGGKAHLLSAGDFYFLNKTTVAHFYPDAGDPYEKIFVSVYGQLIERIVGLYFGDAPLFISHCDVYGYFSKICGMLEDINAENKTETFRRTAVVLFDMISFATAGIERGSPGSLETLPRRIRDYINNNVCEDITLEDIARSFNMSGTHIIRVFRDEFGQTPMKYLAVQRIARARLLLAETSLGINEIAYRLRFEESHYFSRVFRQYTGMTPSEFRTFEKNYIIKEPIRKTAVFGGIDAAKG